MTLHVIPIDDLIRHELSDGCPCGPTEEPAVRGDGTVRWVRRHHSLDGRERNEDDQHQQRTV